MAGNWLFVWNNKPDYGMAFKSMATTETAIKDNHTTTPATGYVNLLDGRRTTKPVQVAGCASGRYYGIAADDMEIKSDMSTRLLKALY